MSDQRSVTVTFLFTDVEDSTRLVGALRDRYPAVLSEHRRLVRDAFSLHGGSEVDTQGDAFFYVFAQARDAAAGAADAQRALHEHAWPEGGDLRVRMGLHTDEAVVSGDGYHGLGVHRAARIMAAAHGGQILTSQATAAVLVDEQLPGVAPRDLGEFPLKGLDRPERVCQLDVDGLPTRFPPLRTARGSPRRRRLVGALAAVLTAGAASALVLLGWGQEGQAEALARVQDNAVGVVDTGSRRIVDEAAAIESPQRVAAGEGAVWVTSSSGSDGGSVIKLDPESHDVTNRIDVGIGPVGIAVGAGAVWVANTLDGTVSRIDPKTDRVVQMIDVGNAPTAVVYGLGAVWVTNTAERSISQIDPVTGHVVRTFSVDAAARFAAVADAALWLTDPVGNELVRVDPRTRKVTDRIPVGSGPSAVAYGAGALWVTNNLDGTVARIDARTARRTHTIHVGAAPNGIVVDRAGVWVTDEAAATLVRIARPSAKPVTTTLGGRPASLTLSDGRLWIAVQASGTSHRGGTLRITGNDVGSTLDPARADLPDTWMLLPVVFDGLVGFKRVGGADGYALVPDLARSLPRITDGGTTYTFRLRKRMRFSDGRPLEASAVRFSFERMLREKPAKTFLYDGIVGAPACLEHPGRCDLSRGIVSDDDSGLVTIRLLAPDPEFLSKLALPFASIVPIGTPATARGPVLGTGPYRIAEYLPKHRVRLERNRYFKEWSKAAQPAGIPNEITLQLDSTSSTALTAVERGRADLILHVLPPGLDEIRLRYAAQVRVTPLPGTYFVALNTRRPPFDDVRARRAVAFAFDRTRAVDAFGGSEAATSTCQLLPPNTLGYHRYCPYTVHPTAAGSWSAPDLTRARKLVAASGTRGMHVDVLGISGTLPFAKITTEIDAVLRQLGYRTSVRRLPGGHGDISRYFATLAKGAAGVQAAVHGWSGDYPSPFGFLSGLVSCSGSPIAAGYVCDPGVDRQVRETLASQVRNPRGANDAWARLDRKLVDQAILVPLINETMTSLVSDRLGNFQNHPVYGALIGQIWVR